MIKVFLRVFRYQNLLIVALTMYLMRFGIIQPLLAQKGFTLQMSEWFFLLLVLSTVFITAAGYVINDYFDTKTDLVNRPQRVVIGRQLSRRSAIFTHWVLNSFGFVFGLAVSFYINRPFFSLGFIIIPGILWFYSTTYKRQFLVGNIIVALLTALVPFMTILFELPLLYEEYWQTVLLQPDTFNLTIYWVAGFAIFAFLLNLFREIVKDIEDYEGDLEFGRNTLPVVLGTNNSRIVASSILMVVLLLITYVFGAHMNYFPGTYSFNFISLIYLVTAIAIPVFILLVKLFMAQTKENFKSISSFTKIVMLLGILFAIIFKFFMI